MLSGALTPIRPSTWAKTALVAATSRSRAHDSAASAGSDEMHAAVAVERVEDAGEIHRVEGQPVRRELHRGLLDHLGQLSHLAEQRQLAGMAQQIEVPVSP